MKTNELEGRVALVTGANSGIGKAIAAELARKSATVIMVSRDMARGNAALQDIKEYSNSRDVRLLQADLASLAEIEKIASAFHRQSPRLDILINNAAIVPARRELSVDGLELQFAVNHLAYFYLTELLLDSLGHSDDARIVNVSSAFHYKGSIPFDDLFTENRPYKQLEIYAMTKLLNVAHVMELTERLQDTTICANAVHPGVIATNIYRTLPTPIRTLAKLFMRSPARGAQTPLYVATDPRLKGVGGKYFEKMQEKPPKEEATRPETYRIVREVSTEIIRKTRGQDAL